MARRRIGIVGFLLCLCLYLMPYSALAVSTADATQSLSPNTPCSLTLSYTRNETAILDANVKLYQIADLSAEAQFSLTSSFLPTNLILNGIQSTEDWDIVRTTLESHILANSITADFTAVTDHTGQVQWSNLQAGLYLAVIEGVSYFDPVLISLPGLDANGHWQYQLTVTPKPGAFPPAPPSPPPSEKTEVQFKVLKLWKGETDEAERPKSIEVEIFRNGSSHQTVVLSEENLWSYTWTAESDGSDWMVVERNVPEGYSVSVEETTTAFILTNIYLSDDPPSDDPPSDNPPSENPPSGPPSEDILDDGNPPTDYVSPDVPETGDTPHLLLYTVLMYASGIALILLGITGKKKGT